MRFTSLSRSRSCRSDPLPPSPQRKPLERSSCFRPRGALVYDACMSSATGTGGRPTVSVIVTTKNRAPLLREAIESVLFARSDRYTLELIVVDDGSTDET